MKKNVLKAVLFDLDGVVFDTEPQYTIFWGGECRRYHPERPGLEHEIKGQTLTQIYDAFFSGTLAPEQEKITQRLNRFEQQMDFSYIKGFETFIEKLKKHGILTAIVTSSNLPKMAAAKAKHPEIEQLFDAILTSEDFAESKPSPDCYLRAAHRLKVEPSQCIVLEDSFNGLMSGRSAGMGVVGFSTTNPASAIAHLCDLVVPDYTGLEIENLWTIIHDDHDC